MQIQGKVVVITGGGRGIGRSLAQAFAGRGANIALLDMSADDLAKTQSLCAESGNTVKTYRCNVAQETEVTQTFAQVAQDFGRLDVLINNAGITRDAAFHRMTLEQWQQVMSTNVDSLFTMTRPVWEGMRSRKFGRVISISSVNGQKGQFGQTNYAAAKAAAIGFTKALAQEGAAVGITVNCICPGYIATEMVKAVPEEVLKAKILPQIPVGRLGEPEEIARCVAFLASDDAGFITGSTLSANGGQYLA